MASTQRMLWLRLLVACGESDPERRPAVTARDDAAAAVVHWAWDLATFGARPQMPLSLAAVNGARVALFLQHRLQGFVKTLDDRVVFDMPMLKQPINFIGLCISTNGRVISAVWKRGGYMNLYDVRSGVLLGTHRIMYGHFQASDYASDGCLYILAKHGVVTVLNEQFVETKTFTVNPQDERCPSFYHLVIHGDEMYVSRYLNYGITVHNRHSGAALRYIKSFSPGKSLQPGKMCLLQLGSSVCLAVVEYDDTELARAAHIAIYDAAGALVRRWGVLPPVYSLAFRASAAELIVANGDLTVYDLSDVFCVTSGIPVYNLKVPGPRRSRWLHDVVICGDDLVLTWHLCEGMAIAMMR